MRHGIYLFLSVVLGVYFLTNVYIGWRSWAMLSRAGSLRWVVLAAVLLLTAAYPLGRYLEHHNVVPWGYPFIWLGSFWIAAMLYLFLAFFALSLFDASAWLFGQNGDWTDGWFKARPWIWLGVIALAGGTLVYGHWNSLLPRVVTLDWALPKFPAGHAPIKVVALSDVHMGTLIGRDRVEKFVALINAQKPDLVLFVGDTIDSDLTPVVRENTGAALLELRARYGVYAVTGNHEYYGGVQPCVDYLEAHGVRVLRDQAVLIDDAFFLVGREDATSRNLHNGQRTPLSAIIEPLDHTRPLFIIDHQPIALDEAASAGADVQISGHTHDGQFWPFNYVTNAIFKLPHGYGKFGSLNAYVSSGIGTWGPMIRVGNHPELLVITLRPGA